jgi:activator of 2-hydroxyglutaryl-CoA dehydratase
VTKVFVTQYTKNLNFAEAGKYGDVIFLTKEEYRPEPIVGGINESITHEIKKNMIEYIPGKDFIITTGSAMPNVIIGGILSKSSGDHNILKWNNRSESYELFKLKFK